MPALLRRGLPGGSGEESVVKSCSLSGLTHPQGQVRVLWYPGCAPASAAIVASEQEADGLHQRPSS